jgi:hypothetical protein
MLKKDITYTNLDGDEVTETFYFHLSKVEIIEMEVAHPGGLANYLTQIGQAEDGAKLMAAFREFISKTVGRRSEDGSKFIKNEDITEAFMSSDAYSELVFQFFTDTNAAIEFVNAVVPRNLQEQAAAVSKTTTVELPQEPEKPKTIDDYTDQELQFMDPEQFKALMNSIPGKNIPRRVLQIAIRRKDL